MRLLVASGIWLARLPDGYCWGRRARAPSYSRYQRLQRLKRPPPPFHAPQRPTTDTLDCPVAPAPLPLRVPASSTRKCPPSLRPPSTPRRAHLGTCPSPAKCPPQSPMPVLQHGSGSEEVRQCSMPPLDPTHLPAGAPPPLTARPKCAQEHTTHVAASFDFPRYSGCPTWYKARYGINIHRETSNSKQKRRLTFFSSIFGQKCCFCLESNSKLPSGRYRYLRQATHQAS